MSAAAPQRYHLLLEYDGGYFCGWQAQKQTGAQAGRKPGVQSVLEEAIFGFCQQRVRLFAAGRTDAGVHARGQHAHFDLPQPVEAERLQHAVNWHLRKKGWGEALAVLAAVPVSAAFHARFAARRRHYCYRLITRPAPLALEARRSWHLPHMLAAAPMRQAADFLQGRHDFTAFRAASCQSASPVKTLDKIEIHQCEGLYQHEWWLHFIARSFLQGQVRALTGALVQAGLRRLSPQALAVLLASRRRAAAPAPAPAHGLFLAGVEYDAEFTLPANKAWQSAAKRMTGAGG